MNRKRPARNARRTCAEFVFWGLAIGRASGQFARYGKGLPGNNLKSVRSYRPSGEQSLRC
uniref:Uncharacterized protein n=1 Tax=uncultured bacterium A1Q1_fos_300 TaxID=1256571 RepID=L7VWD3_9BACT|nr:hypothetical protein [uncultured bacterium A1Q1_fos_300]